MESVHLFDTPEFTAMMDLVRRLRDEGYSSEAKQFAKAFDRAGVPGLILELTTNIANPNVTDLVRQAFPSEFPELIRATARMKALAA